MIILVRRPGRRLHGESEPGAGLAFSRGRADARAGGVVRTWTRTGASKEEGCTAGAVRPGRREGGRDGGGKGYMMSIAAVSTTNSTTPVTAITFRTHLSMVAYCTFASARPASTAPFSGVMMATRPWAAT